MQLVYPSLYNALHAWAREHSLPSPQGMPYRLPDSLIRDPRAQCFLQFPVLLYEAGVDETLIIFLLADGRREKLPEPKTYVHASRFLVINSVHSAAVRQLLRKPPARYDAVKSRWLWQSDIRVTTGVTMGGEEVHGRLFAGWAEVSCPGEPELLADYFSNLLGPARHLRYGHAGSVGSFFPEQYCRFTPADAAEAFEIGIQWADLRFREIGLEEAVHEVVKWDTTDFVLFDTLHGDSVMLIFEGADE